jgi:hypothetical protein
MRRSPRRDCRVELVGMVGQEENLLSGRANDLGNSLVRRGLCACPAVAKSNQSLIRRCQLSAAGVRKPILLSANRAG